MCVDSEARSKIQFLRLRCTVKSKGGLYTKEVIGMRYDLNSSSVESQLKANNAIIALTRIKDQHQTYFASRTRLSLSLSISSSTPQKEQENK